jgi:hypothetical protein
MTQQQKINQYTYHRNINQNEFSRLSGDNSRLKNTALSPTLKISMFSVTFRGADRTGSAATGGVCSIRIDVKPPSASVKTGCYVIYYTII